jgi:hypothetical protein
VLGSTIKGFSQSMDVYSPSSLIKEYREYYVKETDEGIRNLMVNTLENKVVNIFKKYL